jgi:(p)ppGpp synthase/HD superfamily hydrolase
VVEGLQVHSSVAAYPVPEDQVVVALDDGYGIQLHRLQLA